MKVTSEHTVYVNFYLPADTAVGTAYAEGGSGRLRYYLRSSSKESPEKAKELAREAVEAIRKAVENDDRS